MAIITFWSSTKKATGQTMSAMAIAAKMAIEHNYKILLISTQYNDNTIELAFGNQEKNKNLVNKLLKGASTVAVDNGIEGLSRIANSGKLTPDIIQNYTQVVYRNRLEVLQSLKDEENIKAEEYLKIREKYKDIIQNANRFYDMVFVDLVKEQDSVTKEILNMSNIVIFNIEQKINMINEFAESKKVLNTEKKENIILNIGRFDNDSKYSLKNISRYIGIKKDIICIPYNTLYFEAAGEEKADDLFLSLRKVSELDKNSNFISSVEDAVEKIIYKLQELQMRI